MTPDVSVKQVGRYLSVLGGVYQVCVHATIAMAASFLGELMMQVCFLQTVGGSQIHLVLGRP